MQLKDIIVISISLLFCNIDTTAQNNSLQYEILNSLPDLLGKRYTYNDDSIMRIVNKPISPDWNNLLTFERLKKNISWGTDTSKYDTPFDSFPITEILSVKDLEYMRIYYDSNKTFKWKNSLVQNIFIKVVREKKNFEHNNKIQDYYQVSLPVFSVNNNVAIVQLVHLCGLECGNAILLVLRKNNRGRWERLCSITLWMS